MARKKVEIKYIVDDTARKATYKKRSKGVIKKASEIATLCNIDACAVFFGSDKREPDIWPSMEGATQVLMRYKSMPPMEQCKKMLNQEDFLRQQIEKLQTQLWKQERVLRELETTVLLLEGLAGRSLHDVGIEDVSSLAWMIDYKASIVQERIKYIKEHSISEVGGTSADGTTDAKGKAPLDPGIEELQRQNWIMEVANPNEFVASFGGENMPPQFDPYFPWN